jgi:hypothetical protein
MKWDCARAGLTANRGVFGIELRNAAIRPWGTARRLNLLVDSMNTWIVRLGALGGGKYVTEFRIISGY